MPISPPTMTRPIKKAILGGRGGWIDIKGSGDWEKLSESGGPRVQLRTCGERRYYPETSPTRKAPALYSCGNRPSPPVVGDLGMRLFATAVASIATVAA